MPTTHTHPKSPASVNTISRDIHVQWLAMKDRAYSPYGKEWPLLTPEQRHEASRQTLGVLQSLNAHGHKIDYVDEYSDPAPGQDGFIDPEANK